MSAKMVLRLLSFDLFLHSHGPSSDDETLHDAVGQEVELGDDGLPGGGQDSDRLQGRGDEEGGDGEEEGQGV